MRAWAISVFLLAAGCDESFEDPPKQDLYKPPYDFATGREPPDQGVGDLSLELPDLRVVLPKPDLTLPPPPDLTTEPDQH
jgi:hypothetical protein